MKGFHRAGNAHPAGTDWARTRTDTDANTDPDGT